MKNQKLSTILLKRDDILDVIPLPPKKKKVRQGAALTKNQNLRIRLNLRNV